MLRVVGKRLLLLIPVIIAVSFLTFILLDFLPGDPAVAVLGADAPPAAIEQFRAEHRLDEPIPVRYLYWLGDAVQGDLGRSPITRQPVTEAIMGRLPVTVQLVVMAMILSVVLAIPLGIISAYRANTRLDKGITGATFGLLSLPNYVFALLLIYFFSVRWGVFPATGWSRLTDGGWTNLNLGANLRSALLPSLALAVSNIAVFTRLLRTDMIGTLQEDYVLMARAKGVPTWRILVRHALRPSSFSLMTVAGVQVGVLLSGTVIIEEIFALPGLGRLLFQSILQRDALIVQGVVLFVAASFIIINFLVDLLYSVLDPRIRIGGAKA